MVLASWSVMLTAVALVWSAAVNAAGVWPSSS